MKMPAAAFGIDATKKIPGERKVPNLFKSAH